MVHAINLTCPSCGGKLEITSDIDRFACGHCGNEMIVQRGGGIVILKPVVEGLKNVQIGVDKTASELAIVRLEQEIGSLLERKRMNTPFFGGFSYLGSVAAGLAVLSLLGFFLIDRDTTICLGTSILFSLLAWLDYKHQTKNTAEKNAPINQAIDEKSRELSRHQRIVRGG